VERIPLPGHALQLRQQRPRLGGGQLHTHRRERLQRGGQRRAAGVEGTPRKRSRATRRARPRGRGGGAPRAARCGRVLEAAGGAAHQAPWAVDPTGCVTGSVKAKVEPSPTALSTETAPPCSSTKRFTSARPRPVPSVCPCWF